MWVVDVGVLIVDVQINDAIAVAVEELVGGGLRREEFTLTESENEEAKALLKLW